MKISVVVPCYNMVQTISQTLESIWNQKFQDLELIVVDGASTDGTLEYLQEHKDKIDLIISEKDEGQYHAIQKGMSVATGDVLCWLNADDVYFSWTFKVVEDIFNKYSEVNWIAGIPAFLDKNGVLTNVYNSVSARPAKMIANGGFRQNVFGYLQQESMFWRKEVWQKVNGLNLNLNLASDFELWTRFALFYNLTSIGLPLSGFRKHEKSRSNLLREQYDQEVGSIVVTAENKYHFIERLSRKSTILNKLIRLLIWKKVEIIYFSVSKNEWIKTKVRRPISTITFTHLLLEKVN